MPASQDMRRNNRAKRKGCFKSLHTEGGGSRTRRGGGGHTAGLRRPARHGAGAGGGEAVVPCGGVPAEVSSLPESLIAALCALSGMPRAPLAAPPSPAKPPASAPGAPRRRPFSSATERQKLRATNERRDAAPSPPTGSRAPASVAGGAAGERGARGAAFPAGAEAGVRPTSVTELRSGGVAASRDALLAP